MTKLTYLMSDALLIFDDHWILGDDSTIADGHLLSDDELMADGADLDLVPSKLENSVG